MCRQATTCRDGALRQCEPCAANGCRDVLLLRLRGAFKTHLVLPRMTREVVDESAEFSGPCSVYIASIALVVSSFTLDFSS